MSRPTNVEGMGGFKDIRYAEGPLNARSYGAALLAAAHADPRIVALGADLSQPTETAAFRDTLPDRFFMMGIQEANMIGAAGGMARSGDIPFCHSFSVFVTRRVYDQVAMQVAYPKLPVKIVGFIPGLATELGVSHQAIDDLALMRTLPNMAVIEPSGPEQVGAAVAEALAYNGPVFLRLAINSAKGEDATPLRSFKLGVGQVLREGSDLAILAIGGMVAEALQAADLLAAQGVSATVADMASLKPLDAGLVREFAGRHRLLVTAENHSVIGALGSAVAEVLAEVGAGVRLVRVGVQDRFAEGGTTAYLLDKYGLSAPHIAARAQAALAAVG